MRRTVCLFGGSNRLPDDPQWPDGDSETECARAVRHKTFGSLSAREEELQLGPIRAGSTAGNSLMLPVTQAENN